MRGPHALAAGVLAVLALSSCNLVDRSSEPPRRQPALQQRRTERQLQCRQHWQQLQPLLTRFQAERRLLLATEQELYSSGPGQPRPLDPDEQRRLAPYDQELEADQHQQALEAWQQQERQRRTAWRAAHQLRLQQARSDVERAAAALHRLEPRLVDAAAPMGLNPTRLLALERCDSRP